MTDTIKRQGDNASNGEPDRWTQKCELQLEANRDSRDDSDPEAADPDPPSSSPIARRSGGPKSPTGKSKSSKNATKTGIFSTSPIVAGERPEDWEERLEGLRGSLHPCGYLEESLVRDMALNRQQKERMDRYVKATIEHQLATAGAFDHIPMIARVLFDSVDPASAFWEDPTAVRPVLDAIASDQAETVFSPYEAAVFFGALIHSCNIDVGQVPDLPRAKFSDWTMSDVKKSLLAAAKACGHDLDWVIQKMNLEVEIADLKKKLNDEQELRDHRLQMAQALLPSPAELDKIMRYGTHLDREFDRLMHRLEVAQRARDDNLPPPIRIDVQEL